MNEIDYKIEKSVKKVKMSEQHLHNILNNDLCENEFESFKKDISFNEVMKFKIFDSILGKKLHYNICLDKQRVWLGYLEKFLKSFIRYDKERYYHSVENQFLIKIHLSVKNT